ncbi:MAG: serine hydrolase [Cyanophyceae cyanobacterium]
MAETNWSSHTTSTPSSERSSGQARSPQSSQIPPFQTSSVDLPRNLPSSPPPESRNPRRRSLPVRRKLTLLQRLVLGLESVVIAIASKLPEKSSRPQPLDNSGRSRNGRRGRRSPQRPPDPREQQPFGRFPLSDAPTNNYGNSYGNTYGNDPEASPPASFPDPFSPSPQSPQAPGDHRRSRRSSSDTIPLWLQAARTGIVGVGLGAIVGTVMLAIDPATRQTASSNTAGLPIASSAFESGNSPGITANASNAGAPIPAANPFTKQHQGLQKKVKAVVDKYKGLSARVAIVDLDTGDYAVWNDTVSSRAASTIKAPVLVAFFQEVDAGRTTLDQPITLEKRLLTGEAGVLQYQQPGTKITALEVLNKMIVISDNAATNLAINHLGGAAALNERFRQWGLQETTIRTWLPDIGGTNTVTARDMALLFYRLHRGELVSLRSRDRLLAILRNTRNRSLLNQGLGKGASIAHKTGTLGSTLADVGLVDAPNGRRYAIAAIVHRPRNDARAGQLIRELSKTAYQHFSNLKPLAR